MTVIRMFDSLKCKLLFGTSRDATLRWYMGIPRASLVNYMDMVKKLVHQFSTNRHKKTSTTNIFNIWQGPSKILRDYLAWFNEATIRVVPLNQEFFLGEFQNKLKTGHFNEFLVHKLALSLAEVVTKVKCYINNEESNTEKNVWGVNEHVLNTRDSHHQRKNNYTSLIKDKTSFKRIGKTTENFVSLNIHCEHIWHKVLHLHNILISVALKEGVIGPELERWCKFHMVKEHHTEDYNRIHLPPHWRL